MILTLNNSSFFFSYKPSPPPTILFLLLQTATPSLVSFKVWEDCSFTAELTHYPTYIILLQLFVLMADLLLLHNVFSFLPLQFV